MTGKTHQPKSWTLFKEVVNSIQNMPVSSHSHQTERGNLVYSVI